MRRSPDAEELLSEKRKDVDTVLLGRSETRTQAYLSISYVARMTAVTDTVVKHYESGTLLKSLPHGASAESLEKRLDAFYAWIGEMPR